MEEIRPFIRKGGTVIEVGSRDGHDAAAMSRIVEARRTIAIDPNPDCYKDIIRNYPWMDVYQFAITDHTGTVDFWKVKHSLPPETVGQSSTIHRPLYNDIAERITVQCFTMDDFVDMAGVSEIEAMKIDVEGATYELLSGFSKIRMARVLHIESEHIEFWPGQRLYNDTATLMLNAGYEQVYYRPVFTEQSDTIWVRKD